MRQGRGWSAVLGALAMAIPCQAAVQANAADAPLAIADARGARLRFVDGVELRLPLPADARIWEVASLERGWVATASDAAGEARLSVLVGDRRAVRAIPVPAPGRAAIQRRGVPLVRQGELVGLAWLEGSRAGGFGVRAAALGEGGFTDLQWVSRPGPGSQTGLTGTVLADGSWLLLWSAFDGVDDEIVAARRLNGEWRAARRVGADNAVPDITPALVAAGGGALAAWSRYDGERYVLVRASFEGGRWREAPEREPGLYPAFRGGEEAAVLLFFAAGRPGWSALRLDGRGAIVERADAAGPRSDETPLVEESAAGLTLRATPDAAPFAAGWRKPR